MALAAAVACCLTRVLWAAGVSDDIKPLIHLSDFLMGIAAACAYDLLRAPRAPAARLVALRSGLRRRGRVIAWPELLPAFVDLNTALRPLNALLLIGLALGGGLAGAGSLHARGRVPRQIELRDVHPARADAVVVPAMVADIPAAASTSRS